MNTKVMRLGGIGIVALLIIMLSGIAVVFLMARSRHLLIYVTDAGDRGESVAVLDPDTSTSCQVPQRVGASYESIDWARWASSRGQIVFLVESSDSAARSVWTMASDGSQRKLLAASVPSDFQEQSVKVSPTGRYLAMLGVRVVNSPSPSRIRQTFVFDSQTAGWRDIMTATITFAWSPLQDQLALYRWDRGEMDIVQPDGAILRGYSIEFPEGDLVWSPDGKRLGILSSQLPDGKTSPFTEIYSLALDSGETSQVTRAEAEYVNRLIYELSWSPDGKHIAFLANFTRKNGEGNANGLFIVDVATGRETHLADNVRWSSPAWSPDGGAIAFISTQNEPGRTGYGQIYIVDIAKGKLTQVTCFDGLKQSLSW